MKHERIKVNKKPVYQSDVLFFLVEGETEENYVRYLQKIFKKSLSLKVRTKSTLQKSIQKDIQYFSKEYSVSEDELILIYDLENDSREHEKFIDNGKLLHKNTFLTQPCIEAHFLMHYTNAALLNNEKMSQVDVYKKLKKRLPKYTKGSFDWERYGIKRKEILKGRDYSIRHFRHFDDQSFSMIGLLIDEFFNQNYKKM